MESTGSKKTVVVLGGSFGGLAFAKALHDCTTFDVVVIEKRGYCDLNFVSPRLLQDPHVAKDVIRELTDFPWLSGGNVKVVQATVTELKRDCVTASNGEIYKFDYCVVATGSQYANEFNKSVNVESIAKRMEAIKTSAQTIAKTPEVLVIGGGLTGIEMAAEAKEAGARRVTLVHNGPYFVRNEDFHRVIHERLMKIGVNVVLDQVAELVGDSAGKGIDSGLELGHGGPGQVRIANETRHFGMVFNCVGMKPVHGKFVAPLGAAALKANGFFAVNPAFQVKGYKNIFAIGDAVDLDELQGAHLATLHASQVAKTIKLLAKNPEAKLPKWAPNGVQKTEIVCMGKKNSLCLVGKTTVISYVPGSIMIKKLDSISTRIGFPEETRKKSVKQLLYRLWPW